MGRVGQDDLDGILFGDELDALLVELVSGGRFGLDGVIRGVRFKAACRPTLIIGCERSDEVVAFGKVDAVFGVGKAVRLVVIGHGFIIRHFAEGDEQLFVGRDDPLVAECAIGFVCVAIAPERGAAFFDAATAVLGVVECFLVQVVCGLLDRLVFDALPALEIHLVAMEGLIHVGDEIEDVAALVSDGKPYGCHGRHLRALLIEAVDGGDHGSVVAVVHHVVEFGNLK